MKLRVRAHVRGDCSLDGGEFGLQHRNDATDGGLDPFDRGGFLSTTFGMQHVIELPPSSPPRRHRDVPQSPQTQFATVKLIAAKIPQQPAIDRIGLGLDALGNPERLHPFRMHYSPSHARFRQLLLEQTLITATTLKHHDVMLWIETPYKSSNLNHVISTSLACSDTLAGDIQHALADIDTNYS